MRVLLLAISLYPDNNNIRNPNSVTHFTDGAHRAPSQVKQLCSSSKRSRIKKMLLDMDAPPPRTLSAHQKHQVHITTAQTTQRDGLVLAHRCRIALAVVL